MGYRYDANGQRLRKFTQNLVGGVWVVDEASQIHFVYDPAGHLLGEYDKSGAALREYIWLDDVPVALFTPGASATAAPIVYHIHTDHLNTPRAVLNSAGQLRWRWIADPFGTAVPETNPAGLGNFVQNLRMPGQYADSETGLFYNRFRNYDPMIGRYTQSDPIGLAGGINTYAYVNGNPLMYIDPNGLWAWGESLPQGLVDASAGFGDGVISAITFGVLNGQSFRDGLDVSGGVNSCSRIYKGGRVAGATVTLLANATGAIPKTLTHFTTQAGARGIAQDGIRASSGGLFGGGRYASSVGPFPRNPFVPPGSTVGIAINNTAGYVRAIPGTFLNPTVAGAVQLGAMNAAYGAFVNRDLLDQKCECESQ